MGSQTLDILRQGIWASLTGGWYYDPYQTIFCNTFHLYLWLLLFCLPLILYFYVTIQSIYIWLCYVLLITITVGIIKYMNLKLHKLFDTTECILEDSVNNLTSTNNSRFLQRTSTNCNNETNTTNVNSTREVVEEVIELEDMKRSIDEQCEDEKSVKFYPSKTLTSANYKVDVHRKNSTSNSSNSEYSETNSKVNNKVDSTDNESKIDNVISPGTSEEFCTNNNNNAGTSGNVCENIRSVCERPERNIRKNEQRSNSIDVFFSNQQQCDYLQTIPSTSTSSAFELSSPPLNNNSRNNNPQYQQEKGLMFWNINNQWERDQSISGNIDSNSNNETGTNCNVVKTKRNHHLNKDERNLNLDFTFHCNLNKKMNKFNQSEIVYPIVEKNESHAKSSGRFQVHTHGDEEEDKDDSDVDEDDESKSHLIRKRGITSISMCSVDRQSSFSQKSLKLRKQDSINSKESKYSFDSIDKPSTSFNTKSDKQSISFDLSSFDSVDSSSINKSPKESPNPSMYCHISIQNSQKESSNLSLSVKSPDSSTPSIDLTSCNQKEGSNLSLNSDSKDNFEQKEGSPSVRFVNESSLSSNLSKSLGEIDSKIKTSFTEEIDKTCQNLVSESESVECSLDKNKISQSKSQNASQESVKNLTEKQSKEKLNSSIDYELDWLFEHTDSENENMKEKIRHEVLEENASYSVNKIGEAPSTEPSNLKWSESIVRPNGADDEEYETNRRDLSVLNIKRKKRNRRERRPFCRRSLHTQPNNSNFPGPSNSGARKTDVQVMYGGGGNRSEKKSFDHNFSLLESFYKNSQQSEDDYDDDADDDVYVRSKSSNSADNSSNANNNISHKEMLQIFLATRQTKANGDEVFTFKNEEDHGSVTSGIGSCISTSPVAIHHDVADNYGKMERHRSGRHSRTSRRHHGRVKHLSSRTHRRNPLIRPNAQQSPQTNSSSFQLAVPSGTHLAASHNDTTEGAVHLFRDENGELMSYMFDEKGLGLAHNIRSDSRSKLLKVLIDQQQPPPPSTSQAAQSTDQQPSQTNDPLNNSSSSTSGENVCARLLPSVPATSAAANAPITQITQNANGSYVVETLLPHSRLSRHMNLNDVNPNTLRVILSENSPTHLLENDLELVNVIRNRFHFMDYIETPSQQQQQEPKRYYQFRIFPFANIKIHFNRLMLLSLLDHNFTLFYTVLCLFLTVLVAVFGSWLLYLNFYKDINVFIFCFVIAGCQYSMLKSVQPDSSSPTHGFNKIIIFSRPFYFIVISSIVLILHYSVLYKQQWNTFTLYSVQCNPKEVINTSKDLLVSFILYFPLLFSFGLFPQVNTFLMYFLEQIDIYIFGGNATCSVISSVYCIFRSIFSVLLLYGFAYGGLSEPKSSQHILFSIYCGLVVSTSYHLSRCSSDPLPVWNIVKKYLCPIDDEEDQQLQEKKVKNQTKKIAKKERKTSSISRHDESTKEDNLENVLPVDSELHDPLPMKLILTVNARLKSDLIICLLVCIFVFGIHCSTVFSALQPKLNYILWLITVILGTILHYIFPHLRKQLPWLCISRPVLKANEYSKYEVKNPAKIMWFEKLYVYLCFIERNIVYPVLFIASITFDAPSIITKFGLLGGSLILTICALKCLRSSFSDPSSQYLILCFSVLLFQFDFANKISETFLLDYCVTSIIFCKSYEFLLKIQFVVTYIAPWQITWGSAFHAFAQPFSVPHSAMMFLQAFISAVLSSPLYPFLGSAIFLTSYPRPVKFWERDYNTRRSDHSNTRLVTQFDRTLGSDDNNLNSIFYEHLTRSLQHSLCGDLLLGRWGSVSQGDCFVLASDYLNCLIHIVEMGNGLVTFQMRGLEFRGTYCQQREVEAISESVEDNEGCCCCEPGHLPFLLSLNAAFSQRWLAWEVTTTKYVLEGYSISDNPAASMLQVFDFRKVLISYYVRSIIYYVSNAAKLEEWLNSPVIIAALQPTLDRSFVDLDPVFNVAIDEDYDFRSSGITRASFCSNYLDWIQYCAEKRKSLTIDKGKDSFFVTLCFALSLLGRRTLGAASHNTVSSVEFFLYGLHALFKGDFRITCERDEWVFTDMDLLKKVVAPAVKMSLKLHQEHFTEPDDYEDPSALYSAITQHHEKLVISHEGDPTWRNAVLSGTQSLLALRHVLDDGVDEYKVIMLNKRYLSFRIIKMNRECVRGLWAGQQQELVYLRNRNPERGSIQNAKQALRNIINSSCDQPIGYPIFVSPLTTSYAETNEQLSSIVGGSLSVGAVKRAVMRFWRRIQRRCIAGCSSGGNVAHEDGGFGHDGIFAMTTFNVHAGYPGSHSIESNAISGGGSISRGNRSSLASIGKPSSSTLASLAGLLSSNPSESSKHSNPSTATLPSSNYDNISTNPSEPKDNTDVTNYERARIIDPYQVHDALNLGRRIDVLWPDEKMRARGGRSFWKDWLPLIGMEGPVVHKWIPNHRDPNKRSNVDRTILLIKIEDKYVPISESGVQKLLPDGVEPG